ncbi:MAG: alginate export family protein [Phycisphaerales bacterium]
MTRRRTSRVHPAHAAVLALAAGAPTLAQSDPEAVQRLERQLRETDQALRISVPADQPISERLLFDAGATLRFAYYFVDDSSPNRRELRQYEGRVYARAELDGAHRFYARLKFQYDDFNPGDSFDGRGDDWNDPFLERAWYEFDLRGLERARTGTASDHNLNIRAGKQFIHWGSGLTLSNTMFAGLLDLEFGSLGFSVLGGITAPKDVIDFDGTRPGFDSSVNRTFVGAQLEHRGLASHRPYISFLAQIDQERNDFFDFGGLFPTRYGYDSQYLILGSKGSLAPNWTYRAELVKEFGRTWSSPIDPLTLTPIAQTRDDIDAWAGLLGVTWLARDSADTRVDLEFVGATGDDDRLSANDTFGGNSPNTTDRAFNSLGYVNTGLALAADPTNLLSFRAGVSTSPWKGSNGALDGLRLGLDGFIFLKADADAPISVPTMMGDSFVGGELDLLVEWRLLSDVTAILRYGVFFPGEAMPVGADDVRHFLYAGVTYAF